MQSRMYEIFNRELVSHIEFIVELDKLKQIFRHTLLIDGTRYENDAEHSYHIAMMAFLLVDYCDFPVDVLKTMKMLLIHDIVEIDAGDTYAYDEEAKKTQYIREQQAKERIFGLLPEPYSTELKGLFDEFEEGKTNEAKYANALDRFQPLTLNYFQGGGSWKEHGVNPEQVKKRISIIKDASEELYKLALFYIDDYFG